jgi:hypothetical protein
MTISEKPPTLSLPFIEKAEYGKSIKFSADRVLETLPSGRLN